MKTTVEIPDAMFRRAKAYAAVNGMTLKQFFSEALEEKLRRCVDGPAAGQVAPPWMAGFGGLADLSDENRRIMNLIDEDFEKTDPEDAA